MHALIIEDEYLIAALLKQALRDLGYVSTRVVNTAGQAIEAAESARPDLIIADHFLGDGTGTDAVLAICSSEAIPVVFITGEEAQVRQRFPAAVVLEKPFTPRLLEDAISNAVQCPFSSPREP